MDVGRSINPTVDIGQIEGGFAQGYGLFVLEEPVVSADGMLRSRGPGAYKLPAMGDMPRNFRVALATNSSNPWAIFSSKVRYPNDMLLSNEQGNRALAIKRISKDRVLKKVRNRFIQ